MSSRDPYICKRGHIRARHGRAKNGRCRACKQEYDMRRYHERREAILAQKKRHYHERKAS